MLEMVITAVAKSKYDTFVPHQHPTISFNLVQCPWNHKQIASHDLQLALQGKKYHFDLEINHTLHET